MPFDGSKFDVQTPSYNAVKPQRVPMMRRGDNGEEDYILARLRKAKHAIETKGWVQGTFRSDSGAVCLLGALEMQSPSSTIPKVISLLGFDSAREAYTWNDSSLVFKWRVIARIENAIKIREKELAAQ